MSAHAASPEPSVLTSWKEIAAHLGKGVRTVQRWEATLGLPVRRPMGLVSKNIVIATRADLDTWLQSQWQPVAAHSKSIGGEINKAEFEKLRAQIKLSQELHHDNVRLRREMDSAIRNLVATCQRLSGRQAPSRTGALQNNSTA